MSTVQLKLINAQAESTLEGLLALFFWPRHMSHWEKLGLWASFKNHPETLEHALYSMKFPATRLLRTEVAELWMTIGYISRRNSAS
jgi:hypothetical protein